MAGFPFTRHLSRATLLAFAASSCGHFMSHDKRVIWRILYVIIMRFERITRWRCLSVALTVLALVMPARAFIFDSFGDGFWTVINNGNGNSLVVNADQSGSATITLVMSNGQPTANTATNSFLVTVLTTPAGSWRQQFLAPPRTPAARWTTLIPTATASPT